MASCVPPPIFSMKLLMSLPIVPFSNNFKEKISKTTMKLALNHQQWIQKVKRDKSMLRWWMKMSQAFWRIQFSPGVRKWSTSWNMIFELFSSYPSIPSIKIIQATLAHPTEILLFFFIGIESEKNLNFFTGLSTLYIV